MPGYVRWSRFAFNLAAWLFAACVAIQVYLAGLGVFGTGNYDFHRNFGYLFGLLTLVLIVLAILGRPSRWVIGASVLLPVLFAMQSVFVALRPTTPAAAALHPLNGFLILGVSVVVAWSTRAYLRLAR